MPDEKLDSSGYPTKNIDEISCQKCGARLKFKPGTRRLVCDYCGTENIIQGEDENVEVEELDLYDYIQQMEHSDSSFDVVTIKCSSCGAETTLDEKVTSDLCPFCSTPLVLDKASHRSLIKPAYILPFKVTLGEAVGQFRKWIKKLWFAPNKLKKEHTVNPRLKGMYLPYWTYDCDTVTHYKGQKGTNYTTTRNGKSHTSTKWKNVSGTIHHFFDDVLIVASDTLPRDKVDALEPWELERLAAFDEKYLAGFKSEAYSVDLKTGFKMATDKMNTMIRQMIKKDIGGDKQRITSVNTTWGRPTFKHILLPVWISAYRFRNKVYQFLVNASTGEVQGERPWSPWKIGAAILVALIVVWLIMHYSN